MKAADITDVFAWMTADKSKVNLVMDVSPNAMAGDHFGTDILYVFHTTASPGYGQAPTQAKNVICKFASDTSVECWVGTDSYVQGDPSATTGLTSTDGKIKVFAGKRNDPFFFNLDGFKHTLTVAATVMAGLTPDANGCFDLGASGPTAVGLLAKDGTGAGAGTDFFAGQNVNSLVVQVDATLLSTGTSPILGVWGSTNTAP